jgi:hypothetical protein
MAFQQYALKGYNKSSEWQLDINLAHSSLLIEQVLKASEQFEEPLVLVDYGCSEGKNSIILFKKVVEELRKVSPKEVIVFHTDLPGNDWNEFNRLMNDKDFGYLFDGNFHAFTIGRSFFQQILPSNSVHVGYSAYAFHYLSNKPVREPGDFSFPHKNFLIQAKNDMREILKLRHLELVKGGTLTVVVAGAGDSVNMNMGKLFILPFMSLVEQGILSQSDLMKLEWNLHAMKKQDMEEILSEFSSNFKLLSISESKNICPHYLSYLSTQDLESYIDSLSKYFLTLMELQLLSILPESTNAESALSTLESSLKFHIRSDPNAEMFITSLSFVLLRLD